jgi:hypothetical protein
MLSYVLPQKVRNSLPDRVISMLSAAQVIVVAAKVLFAPEPGVDDELNSKVRADTEQGVP